MPTCPKCQHQWTASRKAKVPPKPPLSFTEYSFDELGAAHYNAWVRPMRAWDATTGQYYENDNPERSVMKSGTQDDIACRIYNARTGRGL